MERQQEEDWYKKSLTQLRSNAKCTESDVVNQLILPVLERVLGLKKSEIRAEHSNMAADGKLMRPDLVGVLEKNSSASVIVEAKNLGVDLTKRSPNEAWEGSPLGQLHKYLKRYPNSTKGTWGILTNGSKWIMVQREDDTVPFYSKDKHLEFDTESLDDVKNALECIALTEISDPDKSSAPDWLEEIASCNTPREFLKKVLPSGNRIEESEQVVYAHTEDPALEIEEEHKDTNVYVACLRINALDLHIAPQDIVNTLLPLMANLSIGLDLNPIVIYGVAYVEEANDRRCRGFLFQGGNLKTTALVNPRLPGSRAAQQFQKIATATQTKPVNLDIIEKALSSTPLHRKFHEEISKWFHKSFQNPSTRDLRHLLRLMFVWLLQERSLLPGDALWQPGAAPDEEDAVHKHILWLFTDLLSVPKGKRTSPYPEEHWAWPLINEVPFLNGSLFSQMPQSELPQKLSNSCYLDESNGLLSILSRYDWTLCDRTGYQSETAIDPTMMGELFERLIISTEGVREETHADGQLHQKMPEGTYYTPSDVAEEMATDAIAQWLSTRLKKVNKKELRALVHPSPDLALSDCWKKWGQETRNKAFQLLGDIRFLDPCCGSGAFTLAMLYALWRGVNRLGKNAVPVSTPLEEIIKTQLYAVDIHPMAVMITRLRLFIALIDARKPTSENIQPLPNLETRCMSSDMLCVKVPGQGIFSAHPPKVIENAIKNLRMAREQWTLAYYPEEKERALKKEKEARESLLEILLSEIFGACREDLAWLENDFLSLSEKSVKFDVCDLFPAPKGGWDIVIGNPPYQKPNSQNKKEAAEIENRKILGYQTASTNLYLMFIEAALRITKSKGCITFVVPHSIVCNRLSTFQKIRKLIESRASEIDIRTYDNIPQPLFPSLTWLKTQGTGQQNAQRATILTIQTSSEKSTRKPVILRSRGLIRLRSETRNEILRRSSPGTEQPPSNEHWTQAPTRELAALLLKMRKNPNQYSSTENSKAVTFPPTGRYFISCLPAGVLTNAGRKTYSLADDSLYWPWLGLYNSHLFHAWWLMMGNAFHITKYVCSGIQAPPGWHSNSELCKNTEKLARKLMCKDTLAQCHVVKKNLGTQHNINFHKEETPGPEIIAELDQLLLEAYELPHEPLMEQMRIIRQDSAHRLGN